jgi:hypothetical protein
LEAGFFVSGYTTIKKTRLLTLFYFKDVNLLFESLSVEIFVKNEDTFDPYLPPIASFELERASKKRFAGSKTELFYGKFL